MARPATVAESILDGNGYLYKRANSALWQCRFKVGKIWIIKSTGEKDRKAAIEKAQEFYFEAKFRQRDGLPITASKTFAIIAKPIIEELEPLAHAKPNSKEFNHWSRLVNYIVPYFGKMRITNITTDDVRQFQQKLCDNAGRELNSNTIKSYNSSLNLVFKRALDTRAMTKAEVPDFPMRGKKRDQRPAFTHDEFQKLINYTLRWVEDDGLSTFHQNRRKLLQILIYFIGKTGIRPGTEVESIIWGGISHFKLDGHDYIEIRAEGKVGPRTLVADYTVFQLLESLKTIIGYSCKAKDKVFAMPDGGAFCKSGELFKELLTSVNLLNDPATGQERTLYSLRHYYITESLYRNVSPGEIAKQCGTSITMIDKNYSKVNPRLAAKKIVPKL